MPQPLRYNILVTASPRKYRGALMGMLGLACLCLTPISSLNAAVIFENTTSPAFMLEPGNSEIGDEIQLAGSARYMNRFSFLYNFLSSQPGAVVDAKIRFYLNDGPKYGNISTPGTLLYESAWLQLPQATSGTGVLAAGTTLPAEGVFLAASDLTWSIQFQGLATNANAGVWVPFSPPTVGTDAPAYWWNNNGQWNPETFRRPINFAATIEAETFPIPEPATATLLFCAALISIIKSPGAATHTKRQVAFRSSHRNE